MAKEENEQADEEEEDESTHIMGSLEVTKLVLETAIAVARLLRML